MPAKGVELGRAKVSEESEERLVVEEEEELAEEVAIGERWL